MDFSHAEPHISSQNLHIVIYFAQIVIPRLRKTSPNCAQIVLEKKKHHKIFTRKIEILLENHGVFEKKNENSRKTKKSEWKNTVFFQ